ncbi:recombinase family protein [Nonomuraea sp. NPDC048892]|uniref:recombinase family protein n=1 Tax=Nonomuraea sp. NPDC048892 TaxID=3154624 RepID=UPI0033FAF41D
MTDLLASATRLTVDYCRISRDRIDAGEGVDSQHLDCEESADELQLSIAKTYTDNDISAFSGVERPEYQQLLRDIKTGTIGVLIIWHAKRLHRLIDEATAFIRLARKYKVRVYSHCAGWYNFEKAAGRKAFLQDTLDGQGESEERGERVALARKRQARTGAYGGGVRPYGWGVDTGRVRSRCINPKAPPMDRIYEDHPVWDMSKHRPEEAEEIRTWAKKILSGVPMAHIVVDLNARGVPTQSRTDGRIFRRKGTVTDNTRWGSRTIKAILTNPRVSGHTVYQGKILKHNMFEPIIPEDTRQALITLLNDPSRDVSGGNTPKWLGSLIYECGDCNDGTTVKQRVRNGRPCYVCIKHGHCLHPAEEIDAFIEDVLIERLGRHDAAALLPLHAAVDATALREEAVMLNANRRTLATKLALGQMAEDVYDIGMAAADARLAEISAELKKASPESPLADFAVSDDARKTYLSKDLGQRREILRTVLRVTLIPVGKGRRYVPTADRVDITGANSPRLRAVA